MSTAVAVPDSGQWSRTALSLPDQLTFEEWLSVGDKLHELDASVMWWIGDWLLYGEGTYAERCAKALKQTGYSRDRLRDARVVAAAFPAAERSERVSWEMHRVAAALPRDRRSDAIRIAEQASMSEREFRAEVARITAAPPEPEDEQGALPVAPMDHTLKRTSRVVQAAFSDWFGVCEEYARVVLALYQAGGKPMDWRAIARFVSSHHPMSRGAVHEAIHSLRQTFDAEAIDRNDDGYWLTEIGYAECRKAFRELGQQLIGMGAEAANDA